MVSPLFFFFLSRTLKEPLPTLRSYEAGTKKKKKSLVREFLKLLIKFSSRTCHQRPLVSSKLRRRPNGMRQKRDVFFGFFHHEQKRATLTSRYSEMNKLLVGEQIARSLDRTPIKIELRGQANPGPPNVNTQVNCACTSTGIYFIHCFKLLRVFVGPFVYLLFRGLAVSPFFVPVYTFAAFFEVSENFSPPELLLRSALSRTSQES